MIFYGGGVLLDDVAVASVPSQLPGGEPEVKAVIQVGLIIVLLLCSLPARTTAQKVPSTAADVLRSRPAASRENERLYTGLVNRRNQKVPGAADPSAGKILPSRMLGWKDSVSLPHS